MQITPQYIILAYYIEKKIKTYINFANLYIIQKSKPAKLKTFTLVL